MNSNYKTKQDDKTSDLLYSYIQKQAPLDYIKAKYAVEVKELNTIYAEDDSLQKSMESNRLTLLGLSITSVVLLIISVRVWK